MSARMKAFLDLVSKITSRGPARRTRHAGNKHRSQIESLESRKLLTVSDTVPSILGTVFVDTNLNSTLDTGEAVAGATVRLFEDDGDGVFETNGDDIQFGPDLVTDASGLYCFTGISASDSYFVLQPAQTVGTISLTEQVTALIQPGTPNLIIDSFQTTQTVTADPPAPSSDGSTLGFSDETEALGGERDLFAELTSGVGTVELAVNAFNLLPVMQFNTSSGVNGRAVVTWDGDDNDASPTPAMGLNGRDLTQGGLNTGIAMRLGIDSAGAGQTINIALYQGNSGNVSTASAPIPVTDGTASGFLFIPFTDFTGPVSPNNVDAIQMSLNAVSTGASADGQVDVIGVVGPKTVNIANDPGSDLVITKSNTTTTVVAGESITYTIVVQNQGPLNVTGATVADVIPATILNPTFTSTTTGTVTGNTASGSGNINDTINITVGSTVTYTVTGTVSPSAVGTIINSATVTAPPANPDSDTSNNDDDEEDDVVRNVDLSITKTDGQTEVRAGDSVTYTITVRNDGPSDVTGATVTDTFPATLTNLSFTSVGSVVGVTGNTLNGTGNINDTVNMPAGSTLTYTVTATVVNTATGSVVNTATVTAPSGTTETDPNDNTATDTDTIPVEADLSITKTDNVTNVIPGQNTTYTIVVRNDGPSAVTGATVVDQFPSTLTNVSYTSTITGTVTGNSASGTGNINDTVNMTSGSTITYTVTGTVQASATGQLTNTATVTGPNNVTEINPNNNTATDIDTLAPTIDLEISKTDNVTSVDPGDQVTYIITVENNGPSSVTGAQVVDNFPTDLTNISFTSTATGGATGNTASGTGNLAQTLTMPPNSSVTYTVLATVSASTSATSITNTATVTAPTGVTENDLTNNTATDVDTVVPTADLRITKTDNVTQVTAGQQVTYTIQATNAGPGTATNAVISDVFPSSLTNVSFTSVTTGGATGNTASGTGNINNTVTMPPGSTITYTVVGTVDTNATGQLTNTASITAPTGTTDPTPNNNAATDVDTIDELLAQLSGFVYIDLDDDGVKDANEAGIPNVQVILQQNGTQVNSTTTDSSGAYRFQNLQPGTYDVLETQPTGFADGRDTAAGGQGTVAANDRFNVTLARGDNATNLNFGELSNQPTKRDLLASRFRV